MHYTSFSSVGNYTKYRDYMLDTHSSAGKYAHYTLYTLYTLCMHYTSISSAGKYTHTLYIMHALDINFKCR